MIIGIDAHNLEDNRTGVGRYLFSLLKVWSSANFKYFFHTREYERNIPVRFILYFKDEIPNDLPQSDLFEPKLLDVASTTKFIHWDLWRAAKKDKVNILFCPGYVAPIFWRDKLALTLHDIIYEAHPEWFGWKSLADKILLKWVSKVSARKAKIIFVPSEFSRQEVIKHYCQSPEKVVLTYEAADLGMAASIETFDIKKKYGIQDKFIFYVGSIFNRRHLPEIIFAFSKIADEHAEFQLLLAGKNYTKPFQDIGKLMQDINSKLNRQAILWIDFVGDNDLKLLYSACAFFVYLSDYEGFGLPVLEAMGASAPVITSNSTSLKEVVGSAALLIKNNSDVDEIYRAMKRMIEDDALKSQLIEQGREQAKKFSWKKCAEETLEALLNA